MLRPLLLRLARRIERWLERFGARPDADPVLEPYLGLATPEGLVLRGRVLTHLRRATPDARQSRWVNLRQMASLFLTDEVAGVEVRAQGATARSVHADARALLRALAEGERNPVFYVSSSPWNLHDFLDGLLARHNLPRGPMFLRDLGVTGHGIGETHLGHKGAAIDAILTANPGLGCWLLGDSGQRDAQVYRDAALRHAGWVRGVALREPRPGAGGDDAEAMAAIEAAGVPCFHGPSLHGAMRHWGLE